jgi:O-methyltransferase
MTQQPTPPSVQRYLDLLSGCLTRELFLDEPGVDPDGTIRASRAVGMDWPQTAETMIGTARLNHLRWCVETVIADAVEGDLIETGVWRGGAAILMRGVLAAYGDTSRKVWLADSFAGLPAPNVEEFPQDEGYDLSVHPELAIGLAEVQANFRRYGLLDGQVDFLVGWFKDSLAAAPMASLSVLRLDGDLYESTWQALDALYPRLSIGGFCIVDDYGCYEPCRQAVHDYRARHGIVEQIEPIDWTGSFWRRLYR